LEKKLNFPNSTDLYALDEKDNLFLDTLKLKAKRIKNQSSFRRFGFVFISSLLLIGVETVIVLSIVSDNKLKLWWIPTISTVVIGFIITMVYRMKNSFSESEKKILKFLC
jgi:uncharacterized membrane protein (DUF485 family)